MNLWRKKIAAVLCVCMAAVLVAPAGGGGFRMPAAAWAGEMATASDGLLASDSDADDEYEYDEVELINDLEDDLTEDPEDDLATPFDGEKATPSDADEWKEEWILPEKRMLRLAALNGEPSSEISEARMPDAGESEVSFTVEYSGLEASEQIPVFRAYLLSGKYTTETQVAKQINTNNVVGLTETDPDNYPDGDYTITIDFTSSSKSFTEGSPYTVAVILGQDSFTADSHLGTAGSPLRYYGGMDWYSFTVGDPDSLEQKPELGDGWVSEVTVAPDNTLVEIGGTVTLTAALFPEDAEYGTDIQWVSSDPKVAEAAADGADQSQCIVTGISTGTATITAYAGDRQNAAGRAIVTVERELPRDITETGLNISNTGGNNEPSVETVFRAGDGTVTFVPASGGQPATLILDRAEIRTDREPEDQDGTTGACGLVLDGSKDYQIVLRGENTFTNLYAAIKAEDASENGGTVTILGDGLLSIENCWSGIYPVSNLVFDQANVDIHALAYGAAAYGFLKVLNDSEINVFTDGYGQMFDYGGGVFISFYTDYAIVSHKGDTEIRDSNVSLESGAKPSEILASGYSRGILAGDLNASGQKKIVIDNSTLLITGYMNGIRNTRGETSVINGSMVTIESGDSSRDDSYGIDVTGDFLLDDDSRLEITARTGIRNRSESGSIGFGGRSSVEIISEGNAVNSGNKGEPVSFASYVQFTDASEEKKAAYTALVNDTASPEGAENWRHDEENAVPLTQYQYVKLKPSQPVVSFITGCDVGIAAYETVYGEEISCPAEVLTRPGYTFGGWYSDAACTQKWDFDTDIVTDHLTLYALWLSSAAEVTAVSVNGVEGTTTGTEIRVTLPYGTELPTDSSAVSVTAVPGGTVSDPVTSDQGNTWSFTVTSADGTVVQTYRIVVEIAPQTDGGSGDNTGGGENDESGNTGDGGNSGGSGNTGDGGNSGENDNTGNSGNSGSGDHAGNGGNSGGLGSSSSGGSSSDSSSPGSSGTWVKDDSGWRYQQSGSYVSGSYAVNENGEQTERLAKQYINGAWWLFGADGYMESGWILDPAEHVWYYVDEQTGMKSGWHLDEQDGFWYYLSPGTGVMLTGWQMIDGIWYYLNPVVPQWTWYYDDSSETWVYDTEKKERPYGSMYRGEQTPDGHFVTDSGAWSEI